MLFCCAPGPELMLDPTSRHALPCRAVPCRALPASPCPALPCPRSVICAHTCSGVCHDPEPRHLCSGRDGPGRVSRLRLLCPLLNVVPDSSFPCVIFFCGEARVGWLLGLPWCFPPFLCSWRTPLYAACCERTFGVTQKCVWLLVVWGEPTVPNGHQMARNPCISAVRGVNLGPGHADVVTC